MIGVLGIAAYVATVVWAFLEVTRDPKREAMIMLSFFALIIMSLVAGGILTGGE